METKNDLRLTKRALIILVALSIVLAIVLVWKFNDKKEQSVDPFNGYVIKKQHIYDEAGILNQYDISKFNEYTNYIYDESDIDIRFVFVSDIGKNTIEQLALEKVQTLGIGKENKYERGVLFLYDVAGKRLRIEIGYGLEEYFPDAFVGYLVRDHTRDFFASGDITTGLRLLIRMLHHRIREQILGNKFDPRVIEIIRNRGFLSGGAGVSAVMPEKGQEIQPLMKLSDSEREQYTPQATPEAVYLKYLEWLVQEKTDSRIDIFTPQSQNYMASFPMSKAYFNYILIQEYGRQYKIDIKDNLALQYFTNDPLVTPHFYVKGDRGWQMDIVAEVNNTHEVVGGVYSWLYTGQKDVYTETFLDKFIMIRNYVRIIDGDNRELPIRSVKK
jgi:uncharacterized protein